MKLHIVQTGDPVLRKIAKEIPPSDITSPLIQQLVEDMKETMYAAPGVGLAAPQVGHSLQLAVVEDKAEYMQNFTEEQLRIRQRRPISFHVIINPKITLQDVASQEFYEGCLSVAGLVGVVPRASSVQVECLNEKGEAVIINASGWYARILQHEIDHLRGKLCVDHMDLRTLTTHENYNKFCKK